MSNKWRPDGWKSYIEKLAESNGCDVRLQSIIMPLDDYSAEAFEAGADAMLEELRKMGDTPKEMLELHNFFPNCKVVFIPNDKT